MTNQNHPQAIGTPSTRPWGECTWTWQRNYGITWMYSARMAHDIGESEMTFGQLPARDECPGCGTPWDDATGYGDQCPTCQNQTR